MPVDDCLLPIVYCLLPPDDEYMATMIQLDDKRVQQVIDKMWKECMAENGYPTTKRAQPASQQGAIPEPWDALAGPPSPTPALLASLAHPPIPPN